MERRNAVTENGGLKSTPIVDEVDLQVDFGFINLIKRNIPLNCC